MNNRLLFWSVKRELWENRSIYIAPLVVAVFILFSFLFSTTTLSRRINTASPAKQQAIISEPYNAIAGGLIVISFIVGVFYCLDALHGERRDRSILFWKSLPVSDRTTVLSKAAIPIAVMPAIVLAIIVITQLIMFSLSTIVLLGKPRSLTALWTHMPLIPLWIAVLYGQIAIALWHAPIYAWLLFVSGWAKRLAILWAVLPFLIVMAFEAGAFQTSRFAKFVWYRIGGWFPQAFDIVPKGGKHPTNPLAAITPGEFLSTPGLWVGLLIAAALLVATIRMRRDREPI